MIMILLMVLATAAVVLMAAFFGSTTADNEFRYEDAIKAARTWDAAVSQVDAKESAGSLTLPSNTQFSLNGVSGTVACADNSSQLANSILVSGTLTTPDGRTYPESTIISKTNVATPFYYAMFVNSAFSFTTHQFTTGALGSNGDIYSNGSLSISTVGPGIANTINGNVQSTGSITLSGPVVTGAQTSNASAVTFATPNASSYSMVANATSSNNNLVGYTFGSVSSGNPYPVLYVSAANVNVSGSFSGEGTIYFAGNVTINNTITYANGSSHVAFIVGGNLKTNGQAFVGYWYVNGSTSSSGASLTDSNGALITSTLSTNVNTSLTLDPTVKNSTTTGNLLHLPGYTWSANDILAGSYSGTYTVPSPSDSGTMSIVVSNSGAVTGTMNDVTLGAGTVSGTLPSTGAFNGTYVLGGYTWTVTGTLSLSGSSLTGTLTATSPLGSYQHNLNLTG